MKLFFVLVKFSLLSFFTFHALQPVRGQDQMSVQQSFQTLEFTLSSQTTTPSYEEREEIIEQLAEELEYWNEYEREKDTPTRLFYQAGTVMQYANEFLPLSKLSSATGIHKIVGDMYFEEKAKEYARERDFKVRETFERTATAIVEDYCSGDVDCSEAVFNSVLNDSEVQKELQEADALGAFDEAQTRAYVKNAQEKSLDNYDGTVQKIENIEATVVAAVSDVKNTLIDNFEQVNKNQFRMIRNTARIMHVQQEHTIALENLKGFVIDIDEKIDNITALQQQNLFVSNTILEGVVEIDTRLTALSESFFEMRQEQRIEKIQEVFNNSPISMKIKELENKSSAISQQLSQEERVELLNNLKTVKKKQDLVKVCNTIGKLGRIGQEAISVFCQRQGGDCPEGVSTGLEVGVTLSNIVGNITTGNWAKASLAALGIFKKPEPSPELKILNQISKQLEGLEANMNQGFRNVHEHLFVIEDNLVNRLNIIDGKINQLTQEMIKTRLEILQSLSRVDTKLNYIVNQNECIQDLILEVTLEQNQDLCEVPAEAFINRLAEDQISNFQDLNNFFRGGSCNSCIDALFNVNNHTNSPFFRYTQCDAEGENNKSSPDRVYDYFYNQLMDKALNDKGTMNSLLFVPKNVRVLDSLKSSLASLPDSAAFDIKNEDRYYRNYQAVLDYAHYLLTLFPFMELYDQGRLLKPEEIRQNPGLSKERTKLMITKLEGAVDLINHTIFQQSLMAGNGVFQAIDNKLEHGISGFDERGNFTLQDAFSFNPYLRKNYAAYFLDKVVGFEKIKDLVEHDRLGRSPLRIVREGYNIYLFEENKQPVFVVSLTDQANPEQNIPLFNGYLPVMDDKIDEEIYQRNLEFAYPSSITKLLAMKDQLLNKLGEMRMIASSTLDKQGTELSREELAQLIVLFRE
ncbi:hypothetical protein OKW21_001524 [Catalinimonas alkaloidigena]|uniref:hypothetical protein n=1 Tax=Catalinimonas alkaloidigena TaxID=1075417 RepID=UPI0024058352|nr:hypothetical protein [Catalinimonas alkaloidigena]MDF9796261.1 hypothetical protein [Catalinimonas alkaloidigena]